MRVAMLWSLGLTLIGTVSAGENQTAISRRLVGELGSARFSVRQRAMEELIEFPTRIVIHVLAEEIASNDAEKATRAIHVLSKYATNSNRDIRNDARKTLENASRLTLTSSIANALAGALLGIKHLDEQKQQFERSLERDEQGEIIRLSYRCSPTQSFAKVAQLLGGLDRLRMLQLWELEDQADLRTLGSLSALQELHLGNANILNDDLKILRRLSSLRRLTFYECNNLSSAGLHHLNAFSKLEYLWLSRNQVHKLADLQHLTALTSILCDASQMTNEDLVAMASLRSLRRLELSNASNVSDIGLSHLAKITTLQHLAIVNAPITDLGVEALTALDIQDLNLSVVPLTDACIDSIAKQKFLVRLSLCATKVGDTGVAKLHNLPLLESLYLNNTSLTDVGAVALSDCRRLKEISLLNVKITDVGFQRLCEIARLERLNVSGTAITDSGLERLSRAKQLRHIDLTGCRVSKETLERVKQAFPELTIRKYVRR